MRSLLDLSNYFYTFTAWPPLIVGICSLLLGLIILVRERGTYASRTFLALSICVSLWLLSIGALYSARDPQLAFLIAQVGTIAVAFIPSVLLTLTIVLVRQYGRWKWLARLSLGLSGIMAVSVFDRGSVLVGLKIFPWGAYPQYSRAGYVFLAFFLILYGVSLALLYRRTFGKRFLNMNRERNRQLWLAFSVGSLACIDFPACFGFQVYPIGFLPVYTSLLILAQTIWKYGFSALTTAFAAPHIIRTMPSGLIVTDSDGTIVIANEKSAEYLGRTLAELRHTTLQGILGDLFTPAELQRLIEGDGLRDYELEIKNVAGEPRLVSFSAAFMHRRNGQVEISERHRHRYEFNRRSAES